MGGDLFERYCIPVNLVANGYGKLVHKNNLDTLSKNNAYLLQLNDSKNAIYYIYL
jgi:hypothetical protein